MSEDARNKQCQICKGYLFSDDDIVVCPTCGAPHHRDCFDTIGHCGLEEKHGTQEQYDKVEKQNKTNTKETSVNQCSMCGRTSKADGATFCPYCGQPYGKGRREPHIIIGGVPFKTVGDIRETLSADSEIENVKVSDIAKFTGVMAGRYIPKFKQLNEKRKKSWNWAAFLFPSAWSLSRRMYTDGILYLILAVASKLCFVPFNQILFTLGDTTGLTNRQFIDFINENIGEFSPLVLIMSLLGILLYILPRIFAGLFGDWSFRGHALKTIQKIKNDNAIDDKDTQLMKSGSPSISLMFAALLVELYLPSIIAMFIW